ncbi:hypothetical protein QBC47DRAFT_117571 [Echria macrotheca]|uniref:Mid2 domain-containing protein n=1 Tax=Echria macrotheca TaxID=438768 RepID=A0AAJ0BKG8_9PEZI|nr:hypothetical protein QBC47DRAFT_117571 [Echria macrotheca]
MDFSTIHLGILLLVSSASAACFYPDGTVAQDTPCTDTTAQSSCCGTGYACLGHSSSFFLCQATGDEFQKPGGSQFVRGSCTDKSWRSSNCPNVCVDPNRDNIGGGNGVAACPRSDALFYCISTGLGVENCTTGFNLIDFFGEPSVLTTIGIAPSTTSLVSSSRATTSFSATGLSTDASNSRSPAAGNTQAAPATSPASPSPGGNGTTIGVAVGVSIGGLGLIIAAVAAWFLIRKRRKDRGASLPGNLMAAHQDASSGVPSILEPYKQPTHALASEVPAEEYVQRYELPSSAQLPHPNT